MKVRMLPLLLCAAGLAFAQSKPDTMPTQDLSPVQDLNLPSHQCWASIGVADLSRTRAPRTKRGQRAPEATPI